MTIIEFRQLRALGCSKKALDFYSDTDPLKIVQLNDGSYKISGFDNRIVSNDDELVNLLEFYAQEYGE